MSGPLILHAMADEAIDMGAGAYKPACTCVSGQRTMEGYKVFETLSYFVGSLPQYTSD